jgi:hypothetical protein
LFSLVSFILTTPYFFFGAKITGMHLAAFLFNIGINIPVLLFFATYNTKRIVLSQGTAFNYQGTTLKNFLIMVPLMFFPMLIMGVLSFFFNLTVALWIVAAAGLLGILLHKRLITICVNQFNKRKYQMAEGFRNNE